MKKTILNFGGIILFYSIIIVGVLLLNQRFAYLNSISNNNVNNSYVAMNN